MNATRTKLLAVLLSLVLLVSLLPAAALAAPSDSPKAINMGADVISGWDKNKGYDILYFGQDQGQPMRWRVLDDTSNTGRASTLFVLSESVMEPMRFQGAGAGNRYQGSAVQEWCLDFAERCPSFAEHRLLLPTTKNDAEFSYLSGKYFENTTGILNSDRAFLLSGEEALNPKYGLDRLENRQGCSADGQGQDWHLRSPQKGYGSLGSGFVDYDWFGSRNAVIAGDNVVAGMRPAMNILTGTVLFTSAAVGGKPATVSPNPSAIPALDANAPREWKLTIQDEHEEFWVSSYVVSLPAGGTQAPDAARPGGKVTFTYRGAKEGSGEYISVIIADAQKNPLYYGRLAQAKAGDHNEVIMNIPDLPTGEYKAYLFNETCHRDRWSDTASKLQACPLKVEAWPEPDLKGLELEGYQVGSPYANTIYIPLNRQVHLPIHTEPAHIQGWHSFTFGPETATDIYTVVIPHQGKVSYTDRHLPDTLTLQAGSQSGSSTLSAYYDEGTRGYYGKWNVVAYDPNDIDASLVKLALPVSYSDLTLAVGETYTPHEQNLELQPAIANQQCTTKWYVSSGVDARGNPIYTGCENEYFRIDPQTGAVTAKAATPQTLSRAEQQAAVIAERKGTRKILAEYAVHVTGGIPVQSITLNYSYLELAPGEIFEDLVTTILPENAKFDEIVWTTSDPSQIKINPFGRLFVSDDATPGSKITITASAGGKSDTCEVVIQGVGPQFKDFVDVPSGHWAYDAVRWAVMENITLGIDQTHFGPNKTCTRAQAVTFLWRAAGQPAPKTVKMPFTDVPSGAYYEKAVLWALENNITQGTSATTFGPDQTCSRAQIVTFQWRANGTPDVQSSNVFADVSKQDYFYDAVRWAINDGITQGTSATTFGPNDPCTRAQIVTFLSRDGEG